MDNCLQKTLIDMVHKHTGEILSSHVLRGLPLGDKSQFQKEINDYMLHITKLEKYIKEI